MDKGTMALLTGQIGTVLGAVLIGSAPVGAWLPGRQRGPLVDKERPRPIEPPDSPERMPTPPDAA